MSEKPGRSPKGDLGNTPKKKKKSPAQVIRNFESSTSESDSQEKYRSPAKKSLFYRIDPTASTSRTAGDGMNEYFKYARKYTSSESDAASDNIRLPVLKETEGTSFGLHAAPLAFETFFSPRKTPAKASRFKKDSPRIQHYMECDTDDPPKSSQDSSEDCETESLKYFTNLSEISPSQMSTNAFLEVQKERIYGKRLDFTEYAKDELFPNNPFPKEEKERFLNKNLFVSKEFIDEFTSLSETNPSSIYDEYVIHRATKPYSYEYTDSEILKKGLIHMKRRVTRYLRSMNAVLLTSGILQFYGEFSSYPEHPIFIYHFQDYDYLQDAFFYYIDLSVRDSVSTLKFLLCFDNEPERKEWGKYFRLMKASLNFPKEKDKVEDEERRMEFDTFCNRNSSTDDSIEVYDLPLVLGRGAYGKIIACKHKLTKRQCVMKVMRRDIILAHKGVESVLYENYILGLYHPYLQKLENTLVNQHLVIFIMDFANGGSLHDYVFNERKFSDQIAIYYGAQMISAIIYFHGKGLIFRDLNLSNCYLDYKGNLKITDFGFCIRDSDKKAYNPLIIQDPCYVAPELLQGEPYAFSCDWWSFGVCFYRMLTGENLFYAESTTDVNDKTLNEALNFYSENMYIKDFVNKILEKDPRKRLGCSYNKTEVLEHSIFLELLWKKSKGFEIKPPIRPRVTREDDYSSLKDHSIMYQNVQLKPRKPGRYVRENGKIVDIRSELFEQL